MKPPKVTGVVIHRDPTIVMGGLHGRADDFPLGSASLDAFLEQAEPLHYFFSPQWSFADRKFLDINVRALKDRITRYRRHRFTVLVNDPLDQLTLEEALPGVVSFVWNTNCTADPALFTPAPAAATEFNAAYIARNSGYKRLKLARRVRRLCVLTRPMTPEQVAELRHTLPNAAVPNLDDEGRYRVLPPPEVAEILARSDCGLMLSRIEGQTRSIMEYLLCGLPVVTTVNQGGRDRFLTPANSLYVEANPGAVADGAAFARTAGFDREAIRAEALRGLHMERGRLVHILNTVLERNGQPRVTLEALDLPHKTSSKVNGLDYFFEALGREPPATYVSAPV